MEDTIDPSACSDQSPPVEVQRLELQVLNEPPVQATSSQSLEKRSHTMTKTEPAKRALDAIDKSEPHLKPRVKAQRTTTICPQTGTLSSTPPTDTAARPEQNLCARCAALDMNKIMSEHVGDRHGTLIMEFSRKSKNWVTTPCHFCQFLSSVVPKRWGAETLSLLSLCTRSYPLYLSDNSVALGVVQKDPNKYRAMIASSREIGYILPINQPISSNTRYFKGKLVAPDQVDFHRICQWLSSCRQRHDSSCNATERSTVSFLLLINCESRKIEMADSSHTYAALSYVWGNIKPASTDIKDGLHLAEVLPRTIEDAITVTKRLQIKYLWIDRYCIPQGDEDIKHDQLRQMDRIYHKAEVTIVAAAGGDPTVCLPGVSSNTRIRQPRISIGEHTLVSSMRSPGWQILSSTWSTRAWTYQEAVCSRRLVIFTEQQVYLECCGSNLGEAVDSDNETLFPNLFLGRDYNGGNWDFLQKISQYSKRTLTYDCDALKGLLGVLRLFEDATDPIYHYWGVPVLPTRRRATCISMRQRTDGFVAGLCWQSAGPGRRRPQFPSWSWTGWTCSVLSNSPEYNTWVEIPQLKTRISIQSPNEDQLDFESFFERYIQRSNSFPSSPYIHIEAWTIDLRVRDISHYSKDIINLYTYPATASGVIACAPLHLLEENRLTFPDSLETEDLIGIVIRKPLDAFNPEKAFIMVTKDMGGVLERMGHVYFNRDDTASITLSNDGMEVLAIRADCTTRCLSPWWESMVYRRLILG
ncbi:HET-domain-containing protein [Cucurbitaria berberidis CBS 394.84]|uniref:HET-domain-containing protein n=1 Tax=Cucurbitaria berberidis CBS 394.84 TaxID=1168544 RepID=A0A9P4L6C5_9PLEO|nr:HET-domain-containing protein [Cucurbitaria berberidis CBS 394.84]KAF1843154.1 HET-domain-containing protein [Cucurbitaria berberidis CBS 394.84]